MADRQLDQGGGGVHAEPNPIQEDADPGPPGSAATGGARPYRSHRVPACDFCHRRKARCDRANLDEPCALCRSQKKRCITRVTSHVRPRRSTATALAQTSQTQDVSMPINAATTASSCSTFHDPHGDAGQGQQQMDPMFATTATSGHSSHIVGPAVASDVQMLEQYLYPQVDGAVSHVHPNPYSVYSDDPRNPVVYLKVPKQRSNSSTGNGTSGFKQWEVMENILHPLGPSVLDLYFDAVHPAFPVLDETAVKKAYTEGTLPYTLICEIYAVSLVSWDLSTDIAASGRSRPDMRYMWNTAVSAMHKDFQTPGISTVLSCILDLLGRPITSITYNAINVGSAVALAQSLGLNRNPAKWKLDPRQKNLRIRTWWALLIHDTWASLCHGTPSHIHRGQWDVDLPEVTPTTEGPAGTSLDTRVKGLQTFIALCRLTKLLGEVLSVVYALRPDPLEQTLKILRRTDAYVDELHDSLSPSLAALGEDGVEKGQPGALNLHISFLAVKMCICRTALQATRAADDSESAYYQARCIKAGNALIDAVVALPAEAVTTVFWLPYVAYHFASAATLMMRCALEARDDRVAMGCVDSARKLIDHLEKIKALNNWDLADICLNQCEATVKHMSDKHNLSMWRKRKADVNFTFPQNAELAGEGGDVAAAAVGENTDQQRLSPMEGLSEHEIFALDIQGHMAEELYFPDLWQIPPF